MDIPGELVEAIKRGNVVLFVGAGLSMGAGLPGWKALIEPLADRIHLPPERRGDLLQSAQDYENACGRRALIGYVCEQTDTTRIRPTDNHRRLVQLGIQTWITTNYDDLLEQTLREAGQPYSKVVREQDLPYASAEQVTLLKMHGDREQRDTIILTRHDYDTYFQRYGRVKDKLNALLAEKTFLFVGYSAGDPDFAQLHAAIAYDLEGHQCLAFAVLFDADPFTVSDLGKRNIHVLNIDTRAQGGHPERLGELLDELIRQVRGQPPWKRPRQVPDVTGGVPSSPSSSDRREKPGPVSPIKESGVEPPYPKRTTPSGPLRRFLSTLPGWAWMIAGSLVIVLIVLVLTAPEWWNNLHPPTPTSVPTATSTATSSSAVASTPVLGGVVEISYWTNDTKAEWINAVTTPFNEAQVRTASGKTVYVHVEQLSSGDVLPKIRSGEIQPTIWSPGDMSWVNEANVVWKDLTGRPLTPANCPPTIYTVVGIGMWRPMAEAMGWPDTPIGWDDIVELAADPQGWARYGHPEWGQFKFGHTHPDSSNTGFLAMSTLAYAALDVTGGLTPEQVKSEQVIEAFRKLERNTYHYGMSTRSLFTLMAERGPSYLHAGTNSETGLLATNKYQADLLRFPLVFIFPAGGTFWSENPFCVLDVGWVTDEQREAAQLYYQHLLSPASQETAIDIGLRPITGIALHAPIALEAGTDPRASPETIPSLEPVSGETAAAIKDVFHLTKKKVTVAIVLDTSGSMRGAKIVNAIEGTVHFLGHLARDDEVIVYTFSDFVTELQPSGRVGDTVESLSQTLNGLWAGGNTALYDAICRAVESVNRLQEQDEAQDEARLYGIVLLSDGQDTNSSRTESDMFNCLPSGEDVEGVKVFTIAYGADANVDVLKRIANRTNGQAYAGDPENIEQVYLAISFEQ